MSAAADAAAVPPTTTPPTATTPTTSLAVAAVAFASTLAPINSTMITVALPALRDDL